MKIETLLSLILNNDFNLIPKFPLFNSFYTLKCMWLRNDDEQDEFKKEKKCKNVKNKSINLAKTWKSIIKL